MKRPKGIYFIAFWNWFLVGALIAKLIKLIRIEEMPFMLHASFGILMLILWYYSVIGVIQLKKIPINISIGVYGFFFLYFLSRIPILIQLNNFRIILLIAGGQAINGFIAWYLLRPDFREFCRNYHKKKAEEQWLLKS